MPVDRGRCAYWEEGWKGGWRKRKINSVAGGCRQRVVLCMLGQGWRL